MFVFLLVFVFAGCTKKKTEEKGGTETKASEPAETKEPTAPVNPTTSGEPAKSTEPQQSISFKINVTDIDGELLGAVEVTKGADFDGTAKGVLLEELCDSFFVECGPMLFWK